MADAKVGNLDYSIMRNCHVFSDDGLIAHDRALVAATEQRMLQSVSGIEEMRKKLEEQTKTIANLTQERKEVYAQRVKLRERVADMQRDRDAWQISAQELSKSMEYYRGLMIMVGTNIGPRAFIADDGTRSPEVLYSKLPELVREICERPVIGYSEEKIREFLGWLTARVPELHKFEVPRFVFLWDEFLKLPHGTEYVNDGKERDACERKPAPKKYSEQLAAFWERVFVMSAESTHDARDPAYAADEAVDEWLRRFVPAADKVVVEEVPPRDKIACAVADVVRNAIHRRAEGLWADPACCERRAARALMGGSFPFTLGTAAVDAYLASRYSYEEGPQMSEKVRGAMG